MTDAAYPAGSPGRDIRVETLIDDPAGAAERTRRVVALYVCLAVFFLSAFADVLNGYTGVAILTAMLVVGFPRAGRSSLASMIAITGFALFTMPYIGLVYSNDLIQTAWFALFVVVSLALVVYAEPRFKPMPMPGHGVGDLALIALFLVAGLLLWGGEGLRQITFYAGWACALVHLERVHSRTKALLPRMAGILIFAAVIGYFVTVLWAGTGRIVQLSFALAPILLAAHYRALRLNMLIFGMAAVVMTFVGRLIRFGWSDGLAGLSADSGASPITLTSYVWKTKDVVLSMGSIIDQWILLFLNWFPRSIWPEKPLGIGTTFVDLVFGRTGVSEEHSLAIGIFGEHIFYLPNAWIASVILLIAFIIVLRRSIIRVAAPYRAPVIAFDVWLMTLFWGGMAAFAARVWFALIPIIPYVLLMKWLDKRQRERATAAHLLPQDKLARSSYAIADSS